MRHLLSEAQAKFRKMMADNKALALRIDTDIQTAHLQVSALRAELADTNQRIKDICCSSTDSPKEKNKMAGNVITTCMPPTSTTNTTAISSTAECHWTPEAAAQGQSPLRRQGSGGKLIGHLQSPPVADRGGTNHCHGNQSQESSAGRTAAVIKVINDQNCQDQSRDPKQQELSGARSSVLSRVIGDQIQSQVSKQDGTITTTEAVVHASYSSHKSPEWQPKTHRQGPHSQQVANSSSAKIVQQDKPDIYYGKKAPQQDNNKSDSLTESSEASEGTSNLKHKPQKRDHRRSLKGSDIQRSLVNEANKLDSFKGDLQRSESDGNQNSAPECDLSLKEDKPLSEKKPSSDQQDLDVHRNSPPVKDESSAARLFPFRVDLPDSIRYTKGKTNSDPLDKRRDNRFAQQEQHLVMSTPGSVTKLKPGSSIFKDRRLDAGAIFKDQHSNAGAIFKDQNSNAGAIFKDQNLNTSAIFKDQRLNPGAIFKEPNAGGSWLKTTDVAQTGKWEDSSSKDETSDSQDALTPSKDDCQSRHLVFDSTNIRRPCKDWRSSFSETYRDHQSSSSSDPWRSQCDTKDLSDMPKYAETGFEKGESNAHHHDKAYFRKSDTFDCQTFDSPLKAHQNFDPNKAQLMSEIDALKIKNSALLRDLEEIMESRDDKAKENAAMGAQLDQMDKELKHAKEALSALKQDRKRLKAEKFDLLTQMKQLYSTLEDKEEELREFIRNYEQKMKDSDENMKQMAKEREEMEQEKWNILKRARDEAERAVLLCTQIGLKDAHIKELQEELNLMQEKYAASNDLGHTNGFGSPGSVSYRTANGIDSRGTTTPTPGSDPTTSPSYAGTPTIAVPYNDSISPMKGLKVQELSPERRGPLMSRSAEDIFNSSGIGGTNLGKKKIKEKKGTWGSISRVFSRSKNRRKALDPELFEDNRTSWSPKGSVCSSPMNEESYVQKLRLLEETHGTPMHHWRAATVLAWLEITMDMPQYGILCAENIKSGKVLIELSEPELEQGLGITNNMHRRKLRLAIEEHRQPSLCRYPKICLMTHSWVVEEWLSSIALTCYLPSFSEHLVDGRVLDTLTKKDLEKHFGITRKFHQLSIMHGIQLLRMLGFDRQILNQRRMNSDNMDVDPLVWTNQRLIKWAISIDLGEYADNLRNTGVHGALAVLESSFTADTIATALGIPTSKNIIRRHLTTEWQNLIQPARLSLESESMVAKKSKSEKKLTSGSSSISLVSQGRSGSSSMMPSYARRTLDRYDRKRSSWRFSTWKSSQESLKSTTSKKSPPGVSTAPERPRMLPLSPKLNSSRHRRTFSSHSDVETLTVTPV